MLSLCFLRHAAQICSGASPLARAEGFVNVTCPACGGPARRETNTMDTFVDSSWYFYRFADPTNASLPFSPEAVRYWLPVDFYSGGVEHAILQVESALGLPAVVKDPEGGSSIDVTLARDRAALRAALESLLTRPAARVLVEEYVELEPFLSPYPAAMPGFSYTEIPVTRGFWMVRWFLEEFGWRERQLAEERGVTPESLFEEMAASVPPARAHEKTSRALVLVQQAPPCSPTKALISALVFT